jgi:hypothetical protein
LLLQFSDSIIGNIRKQYIDTRTQANLSKLNANSKQDEDFVAKHMSEILEGKRNAGDVHLLIYFVFTSIFFFNK